MKMNKTIDLKSFHYLENGEVSFSILDTVKTTKTLDPGSYTISFLPYPANKIDLQLDKDQETVKIFEFTHKEKLDNILEAFFNKKVHKKMTSLGFYHKVGLMLHGKEGTGKSTIFKYYYNQFINNHKAILFHMKETRSLKECWEFVMKVRQIQNNPIIVIFEEMDEQFGVGANNEPLLKLIFDGNMSIDNCIMMCTTNYIARIPEAIKDRPSRIKYSFEVDVLRDQDEIAKIIRDMIKDTCVDEEIKKMAKELVGSTLDEIKQACIDKIMDIKSYKPERRKIGFSQ